MKPTTLFAFILLLPFLIKAQNKGLILSPESGLSIPLELGIPKTTTSSGYQAHVHLDKKWNFFGLGLYTGFNSNRIGYDFQIPSSNSTLSIARLQNIQQRQLQHWSAGLGPLLSFRLSEKIGIDLSSKFGLVKINFPNFEERIRVGTGTTQEYTLYSTNSQSNFYPQLLSFMRLQYKFSDRTSFFLSGSLHQTWNVKHAYRYLDANFSPSMSNESFLQALRTAPTIQEIRKCYLNTTGLSVGMSIQLSSIKKDSIKPVLPVPITDSSIVAKNECSKLKVSLEKQTNPRSPCCYRIVLNNLLDPKSSWYPASFQLSITNGNITEVLNTPSGWIQSPASVLQKVKQISWYGPNFKIPAGQTQLASICVEGLTPVWLDFVWLDRTGKEICRNAMQLQDCINEPEDLCDRPLIRNSGFELNPTAVSAANWKIAYGSPNFVSTPISGFLDLVHLEASGSLLKGDAITQNLDPNNKIRQEKKYLLSAGVRFFANQNTSTYARVGAIAYNGALPVFANNHPGLGPNVALIGRSTKIRDCGDWVSMEFFVWTANKDFDNIAIYVFTDDGNTAKVLIDNITLCEVKYDDCAEIQLDANNEPIRPLGLPPPPPNFSCKSEAEEDAYQTGSLSDLYGGAPYNYNGTTDWYANASDKCFSIGGTIPDEVNNYNCDDSLKLAGINLTCDELAKLLENPDLKQLGKYNPPKLPAIPDLPKGPPCFELASDAGGMAFGGKDIIYIHGLELSHVIDRIKGKGNGVLRSGALANWPNDPKEFYDNGYYKDKAEKTWFNHNIYFTNNPIILQNNFKNRYLVVAYNCSQRLDVAVHAVLSQIREAMANGKGVIRRADDPRGSACFGKEFIIISQSTGAMVADVLLTIASDTKTSPKMAAKYGNIGYIADRCKGHVARRGAFTGSDLATILVALAKPTPGASAIATALLMQDGDLFEDLSNPNNFSIIRSSILVDLIPPIARSEWGPYFDRVPVKVLSVSGGHPTFFDQKQIAIIANIGLSAVGPSTTANAITTALTMKYIVHPGFDDGVITTDCATGRKSTFLTPSSFQASNPIKAFDMGVPTPRAIAYFLDQKKKTDGKTFRAGATPYLSPTGMVQPVSSANMNASYQNHFTFVQAAGEHWIKKDLLSCNYNTTAIGGSRNYEEQLVVNDAMCFDPVKGIVDPAIIPLMKEDTRGKSIPIFYIKIRKIKGIPIPTIASRPFWIWKRTYHNLVAPNHQLSSQDCWLDCDYVYRFLFKN